MRAIAWAMIGVALAWATAGVAQTPPSRNNAPMRELIAKLQGEWAVVSTLEPNDTRPPAERQGLEIWKSGPGGRAVIEEYWSSERKLVGHATLWEASPGRFKALWCDESGCRLLARPAEWRNGLFVIEDEASTGDGSQALRETFGFTSPDRFTQRLYSGPSFDKLALIETITAVRRK